MVSAGLTFFILLAFAFVVGRVVANKLRDDFRSDVQGTTAEIQVQAKAAVDSDRTAAITNLRAKVTGHLISTDSAARITISGTGGSVEFDSHNFPNPAPQLSSSFVRDGGYEIYTLPIIPAGSTEPVGYVQFGRKYTHLDATIERMWLFLGLGVLGGTILAALAGIAVASRAMRPVSSLTAAAREIATTRDTSRQIPQPEADDEVAELAGTLDDMLRELDAARSESQQMMQAQREFVADASHELRTPLTSILANLELLQHRLSDEERGSEQGEIVDSALRSSRRMRRLVSDLLLLARADAGRMGIRTECDLVEIAAAALSVVRPVANGHALGLDVPESPVPIEANPDEVHRLIVNLLENGIRHTPAGTQIEVAVARRNGDAVVQVSDDGPGLPPGMEAQIFSRFVRGSGPADLSRDGGTGLGLAIVQAVAQAHGGRVEAGSSAHGGAQFTVELPLQPPAKS